MGLGRRESDGVEREVQTALERYPDDVQFQVLLAENRWNQGRRGEAEALVAELAERAQRLDSFQSLKAGIEMATAHTGPPWTRTAAPTP